MTPDDDETSEAVETAAAVVYAGSFTAAMSREGWETIKARAEAGGGYAAHIVERCYWTARMIVEILGANGELPLA